MTSERTRYTRDDVIEAAGRLFAKDGYDGTSMRDLGRELGLLGSSLYAHVDSKQDLLVAVISRGAEHFQTVTEAAAAAGPTARDRLRALIAGHVGVVLDHRDTVRTFLNEARALDGEHRRRVIAARDRYEAEFRRVLADGIEDGSLRSDLEPKVAAIFVLSILNALERWYDSKGPLSRPALVEEITTFVMTGIA